MTVTGNTKGDKTMRKSLIVTVALLATMGSAATAQTLNVYKGDQVVATYTIGTDADRVEFTSAQGAKAMAMDSQRSTVSQAGAPGNFQATLMTAQQGVDIVAVLDLYDDDGTTNGRLSDGTYRVASGTDSGTLNSANSYVQRGSDRLRLTEGTLSVTTAGDTRTMTLNAVLDNGERFVATLQQRM